MILVKLQQLDESYVIIYLGCVECGRRPALSDSAQLSVCLVD